MSDMQILPLHPGIEDAFYALTAEFLPDSDPDRMRAMSRQYPEAFLAMLEGDRVIGAAFGWPRRHFAPEDPSFTLDGIVIRWDHMRQGLGKQLLAAFERAAAAYGAPAVSAGSSGGYVEQFYIACGYRPKEYKLWQDGKPAVIKVFSDLEDYRAYPRPDGDGFIVMEKNI